MTQVRVRLTGPDAELGRIMASDVARLLQGFERAVSRAAAGIAGRRPGLTGRRGRLVERATGLLFDGIEAGSVTTILEVPERLDDAEEFDLQDIGLGDAALLETLDVLELAHANRDVADALAILAENLDVGGRFDAIDVEVPQIGSVGFRTTSLDVGKRRALRQIADADEPRWADELYGVLFEANFERRTAQLRLPTGQSVTVTFGDELADSVHRALRERSHLEGVVTYDADTTQATAVDLRRVRRVEQQELGLTGGDFWHERSWSDLADEQGVEPLSDPIELRDEEATDEEVAAFFEALGR